MRWLGIGHYSTSRCGAFLSSALGSESLIIDRSRTTERRMLIRTTLSWRDLRNRTRIRGSPLRGCMPSQCNICLPMLFPLKRRRRCYLYRSLRSWFAVTTHWKYYDPFLVGKEDSFKASSAAIYSTLQTLYRNFRILNLGRACRHNARIRGNEGRY